MKFKYIVRPSIPIRGVFGRTIHKETLMELEKEEVKTCLKHGPVFRRFDLSNSVKVTLLNLDRLHNEKFIPENEWNTETPVVETVTPEVTSEEKEEPAVVETVDAPVEELKEEVVETVEETTSEPETVEETEVTEDATTEVEVTEEIVDEVAEAPTMEGVDFITEEDKAPVEEKQNYNNYKKKRR